MKKKIFITCMIFLFIFLCIFGYKFFIAGNNKNIERVEDIEGWLENIRNYDIEANVIIYSNKNSNTYNLKQHKKDNYQRQEIFSNDEGNGMIIENEGNRVIIKNTKLELETVFDNYDEVAKNSVGFDSFIEDYENSD